MKDERLRKQVGDFGEQLIMFICGRIYQQKVACVDHVGADLIAAKDKERRAISVKTRVIGETEGDKIYFDLDQQKKLQNFADDYGLIATIAFIYIDSISVSNDFKLEKDLSIDVYIVDLEELRLLAVGNNSKDKENIGISRLKDGSLGFSNAKRYKEKIQRHPMIKYQHIIMNAPCSSNRQGHELGLVAD